MSSAAPPPYPPVLLYLPAQILQRLPPQIQSYDVEAIITLQAALSLPPCLSINGPVYTLPLALFCLAILSQRSSSAVAATSSYLSHFLFLWIISTILDLWWLLYRSGSTGSFVTFCVGASMVLKVVSGGLVGQLIGGDGNGAYPGFEGGGIAGGGAAGWMSRASTSVGTSAQGGLWSTGARSQGVDDLEEQLPGGYSSIYDEDEENAKTRTQGSSRSGAYGSYADARDAADADAQQVNVMGPPGAKTHKAHT